VLRGVGQAQGHRVSSVFQRLGADQNPPGRVLWVRRTLLSVHSKFNRFNLPP